MFIVIIWQLTIRVQDLVMFKWVQCPQNGSMKLRDNCYGIVQNHCNIELCRAKPFKWFKWDSALKITTIHLNHSNTLKHGLEF